MTDGPIIEVDQLTRKFGSFTAVDRVSFQVHPGEIFGYLGANGAGKSTTIRMLCGILPVTSGRAAVVGVDVAARPQQVKRCIGYMSQKFSLYTDLTVEENLSFFGGVYQLSRHRRKKRIEAALAVSNLTTERNKLTGSLPGGIRQRLALASALLHEPRILFLDEPTAGVDPVARRSFWKVIRQLAVAGHTLFVTTHHLDEAEYCDRVGFMVDGRLVALDTPSALKRTHVPGVIHEVSGNLSARLLAQALADESEVLGVRTFGAAAHVRVIGDLGQPDTLTALLAARGFSQIAVGPAEATLEDVFLELASPGNGDGSGGSEPGSDSQSTGEAETC